MNEEPRCAVQRGSCLGRKKRGRKETDDTEHGFRVCMDIIQDLFVKMVKKLKTMYLHVS